MARTGTPPEQQSVRFRTFSLRIPKTSRAWAERRPDRRRQETSLPRSDRIIAYPANRSALTPPQSGVFCYPACMITGEAREQQAPPSGELLEGSTILFLKPL